MAKPGKTGLARVVDAWGYSIQGLRATWQHEAAFRQEGLAVLLLVPCAFIIGATLTQTALLLATLFAVLAAEMVNSAIESVVDRISDEQHELAGRAKDQGSALVFIAIAGAIAIWLLVIVERLSS